MNVLYKIHDEICKYIAQVHKESTRAKRDPSRFLSYFLKICVNSASTSSTFSSCAPVRLARFTLAMRIALSLCPV